MIAIGHSILISVWHVLHDNVSYNELGADYVTSKVAEKRKIYLKKGLEALGFEVNLIKAETA